ncbi:MAG: transposase family protein, partial [Desulfobacteraceae bacterium]|nr:transposase family protein [Desulfobacteraceae bacterium]
MYWRSLRRDVRRHMKACAICQKGKQRKRKYGKLPVKLVEVVPWRGVSVDLIGPYTLKAKDGTVLDFMCLTMIDPATGWFEMIELPLASVTYTKKDKEITEIIIDKSSAEVSRLFNKQWLSRYPRSKYVIFDNGSEFKLHFQDLCKSYGLEQKPTTVRNPQANAILERIHAVIGDMLRTSELDMAKTINDEMVDNFIVNAAWAVRSTHHSVLKSSPGAAIFGRDVLFGLPYLADWT